MAGAHRRSHGDNTQRLCADLRADEAQLRRVRKGNLMSATTQSPALANFRACPTCGQYSHSIGEDAVTKAFMHFQTMICENPMKAYPTGHLFQAQTRDAARVLCARIESLEDHLDIAQAMPKCGCGHDYPTDVCLAHDLIRTARDREQVARITQLKQEITALEARLAALRRSA